MPRDDAQRQQANGAHLARVHPQHCDLAQRPECLLNLGGLAPRVRGEGGGGDADQGGAAGAPGGGREAPGPGSAPATGDDGPRPVGRPRKSYAHVIKDVLPGDLKTLQAKTGLSKTAVWRLTKEMHGAGEIHIVGWAWLPHGGKPSPTFAYGPGKDAVCNIKPMSQAQKSKRHRKKAKSDGRWDSRLARQQALYWADRALTHRDPMIEALFGPARRSSQPVEAVCT